MDPDLTDLTARKAALRRQALEARGAVEGREAREAAINAAIAALIAERFAGQPVSTFFAMRSEIDTLPGLAAHAGPIGLPVIVAKAAPLLFRQWRPGEALVAGRFGTSEPGPEAPPVIPRLVLTPLAGFDRVGHRIGYGGGFYDRTLAKLRAEGPVMAVGIAFRAQQLGPIPVHDGDQPLDAVITEDGVSLF